MQELPTSAQVTSSVNNTQQKMAQLSPQRAQEAPSGQGGAEAGEPSSSSDRFEIFRVCSASVPMFIGSQQACEKHPEVSSRNKEAPEKASCLAMRVEPPRAACIATASPSDGENPAEVAWKVRVRPSSAAIHRLQQVLAEGMAMDPQTEAVDGARVQDANVVGSPTSQSKEREAVCRDRLLGKRPCTQEEGPEAAAPRCRAVVAAANRAAQAQSFCQDALQHKICCMAPPQDNESRTALKEKIRTGMDLVMWRWNIK